MAMVEAGAGPVEVVGVEEEVGGEVGGEGVMAAAVLVVETGEAAGASVMVVRLGARRVVRIIV